MILHIFPQLCIYQNLTQSVMKRFLMATTLVAAMFVGGVAYGANPENYDSVTTAPAAADSELPTVSSTPKLSGFVITNFLYKQDAGTSFNVRNVNLSLDGSLGDNFDYKVQFAFAGSPKLSDAYGRVKFNQAFNLQIGQFRTPFTLEGAISPTGLEAFDNSLPISTFWGGRDIGVALYGAFGDNKVAEYSVGVFNGSGTNKADVDKYKDYIGRVIINTPIEGMAVSASFHLGNSEDNGAQVAYNRFAAGFKYDSEGLFARSEYLWGGDDSAKAQGVYGLLGYKINPRIKAFAKYDWMQFETPKGDFVADTNSVTAGMAYHLNNKVFFRFQYQMLKPQGSEKIANNVGAGMTVMF